MLSHRLGKRREPGTVHSNVHVPARQGDGTRTEHHHEQRACRISPLTGIVAPAQSTNPFSLGCCSWRRTTSCFLRHPLWKTFRGIAITLPGIAIALPAILIKLIGINPGMSDRHPPESLIDIARNE
jgi:hypothetical protein